MTTTFEARQLSLRALLRGLSSALILVGCAPAAPDGLFACDVDPQCPRGLSCDLATHRCWNPGRAPNTTLDDGRKAGEPGSMMFGASSAGTVSSAPGANGSAGAGRPDSRAGNSGARAGAAAASSNSGAASGAAGAASGNSNAGAAANGTSNPGAAGRTGNAGSAAVGGSAMGWQAQLARLGDACTTANVSACATLGSPQLLRCDGARWADDGACSAGKVCGYASSASTRCADIPKECVGQLPNAQVCMGQSVYACSSDLASLRSIEQCTAPLGKCDTGHCTCTNPCGSDCPDFSVDPKHCGTCNHTCDGACKNAACEATQLASADNFGYAITVDGDDVFWVESNSARTSAALKRVSRSGGAVSTLATGTFISVLAVDARNVYLFWEQNSLVSLPRTGGTRTTLVDVNVRPGLATDGSYVYYSVSAGDTEELRKTSVNGGTATTLASNQKGIAGLALNGGELFWTTGDEGALRKVSVTGGTVTTLQAGSGTIGGALAVDSANVFWTDYTRHDIRKIARSGGSASVFVADAVTFGLASDGTNLYWASRSPGQIMKQAATATSAVVLATAQVDPIALAVDKDSVYWLNRGAGTGPGTVMKTSH